MFKLIGQLCLGIFILVVHLFIWGGIFHPNDNTGEPININNMTTKDFIYENLILVLVYIVCIGIGRIFIGG